MKLALSALLAGMLMLSAGTARAEDKVGKGAENTGKTVTHGTTSVGKGASKIYHDLAGGVHKVIAKNAGNKKTEVKHMEKANLHHEHAAEKAKQSEHEMNKAEKSADKVGK